MIKRSFLFFLSIIILACSAVPGSASEIEENSEEYYCETAYYAGDELVDVLAFSGDGSENPYTTVVGAIEKTVYVSETVNEEGKIIDSHLMSTEEVDGYLNRTDNPECCDVTDLGNDTTTEGTLTITLYLCREENETFYLYGSAKWNTSTVNPGSDNPSDGKDFIALTWGGNGAIVQAEKNISGTYDMSSSSVSFSQARADAYSGICWQFNEKITSIFLVSDWVKNIYCNVELKRTSSTIQGKETAAKLTYIHTYQDTTGTISFEEGNASNATTVNLSDTVNSWKIEISIPGINY